VKRAFGLIQGFSAGGEVGGPTTFLMESAAPGHARPRYDVRRIVRDVLFHDASCVFIQICLRK
jgi:hypothetical protein